MTEFQRDLAGAENCLNNISDYIDFEKLYGTDSHCSRIFHAICTEKIFGLISAHDKNLSEAENNKQLAELLLELHDNGISSIQLVGCDDNGKYQRGFFCTYNSAHVDSTKTLFLNLGKRFNQAKVAIYDNKHIRVLNLDGSVFKMFNVETLEPAHLKKIWNATLDSKAISLESGFLSGNPIYLCGPMYDRVGLVSDVTVHLLKRVFQKSKGLIRHRPFESVSSS